jgi:XisH protein
MPAKDIYHDAVKNAILKDGWTVAADPYYIVYKKLRLIVDPIKEIITKWIN